MDFQKWIVSEGGTLKVAKRLGVTVHAVRVWTRGDGNPKIETIRKILKLAKGKLSYTDVIERSKVSR